MADDGLVLLIELRVGPGEQDRALRRAFIERHGYQLIAGNIHLQAARRSTGRQCKKRVRRTLGVRPGPIPAQGQEPGDGPAVVQW